MSMIEVDLCVVGAGAVGASCAYQAARRGLKVAIVDAAMPAAGTSGACDGYIAISSKKPGLMMELAAASKVLFPEIAGELPANSGYHAAGGVMICETEAVAERFEAHARLLRQAGTTMTFLAGRHMLELEPELSPDLFGVYHIPSEAGVTPYLWTYALVEGARALGARTLWQAPPRGFELAGRHIAAMDTPHGRVRAEHYCFCAGVWSRPLGALVGIEIPVVPRRGELAVTARGAAVARGKLLSAMYLAVKGDAEAVARSTDPVMRLGHGFSLEVTAQGQSVIGGTRVFAGYDRSTTTEGIATIMREAVARVPALARARIVRTFAGLRPWVPDGKPIVGRSALVENLLVATGHEGDGISLSAVTGALIADLATGARPRIDIAELSPDRFGRLRPEPPVPPGAVDSDSNRVSPAVALRA